VCGPITITISNVLYVPDFMANIIAMDVLKKKGLYWNHRNDWLETWTGKAQFKIYHEFNANFILKKAAYPQDAPKVALASSRDPRVEEASPNLWHVRLGHPQLEAIKHLETATRGVKVSSAPKQRELYPPCETCAKSNIKAQVSRRPMDRGTKPYEHLHLDLIEAETGIGNKNYCLHFYDSYSGYHLAFPTKTKSQDELLPIIKGIVKRARISGHHVLILHHDNEKGLGGAYDKWAFAEGIRVEATAPYTPRARYAAQRRPSRATLLRVHLRNRLAKDSDTHRASRLSAVRRVPRHPKGARALGG
jgi:hypothetical protein